MSDFTDDIPFDERDEFEMENDTTCQRCGATGLTWHNLSTGFGKWRLYEGNKPHVCKANPNDFPDLS